MNRILTLILLGGTLFSANAQKEVYLTITHQLNGAGFAIGQTAQNNLGNSFQITRVDYYLSGIKIIHDGGQETLVPNHYILARGNNPVIDSLGIFNVTNIEGIKFSVGVDSPANNADPALYSLPHPLAYQTPSMHWGWSSGYRFVCLEGMAGSGLTTNFQLHGLWNANYFQQTKTLSALMLGNKAYINLNADYAKALQDVNVSVGPIDHGTNQQDLKMLQNFRDLVFTPGSAIPNSFGEEQPQQSNLTVYPNPSNGKFFLNDERSIATEAILMDLQGKRIRHFGLNQLRSSRALECTIPGQYFLSVQRFGIPVQSLRIVIQ